VGYCSATSGLVGEIRVVGCGSVRCGSEMWA
jgi:hypothetical protein